MRISIFYAWQSDTPGKVNHWFIHEALDAAVAKLNADASIDGADIEEADSFEVDHDTKGIAGSPPIAETICAKIDACTVFVGDLTTVGTFTRASDNTPKKTANPNVLIELGYTRAGRRGVNRIVTVQNLAFGTPDDLPFDLKQLRRPIQYRLSDPKAANRDKVLNDLAGILAVAIRAIVKTEDAADRQRQNDRDQDGADAARAHREKFEAAIAAGRYKVYERENPRALVMSLFPQRPPDKRLTIPDSVKGSLRAAMKNINFASWQDEPFSGSYVAQCPSSSEKRAVGMIELTDRGAAFVILDLGIASSLANDQNDHRVGVGLIFREDEMYRVAPAFVAAMRRIGVKGNVMVGVSLIGAKNCLLHPPGGKYWASMAGRRMLDSNLIAHDFIDAGIGEEFMADGWAQATLRPAFEHFWMDAGYRHDPLFWEGKYQGPS